MNQNPNDNQINVPRNLSLLYIIFMKCIRGLLIYLSLQMISDDNVRLYSCFISFYLVDRILATFNIFSYCFLQSFDHLIVLILIPFCIEDLYLIINCDKYPKFNQFGRDMYALITSIYSLPMHIASAVYIFQNQTPLRNVFLAFIILSFALNFFIVWLVSLFEQDQFIDFCSDKFLKNFAKEFLISTFNFVTYLGLIITNFSINYFGYFLLIFDAVLIFLFMTSIFKQINYFVAKKPFASLLCFVIGIKQLMHIDIDQRQFTENRGIESLKSLRPSFFNKMIIFSFVQKLFLLIALLNNLTYFKQYIANQSLSFFDFVILIMSFLSLLLIGNRFKKYVLNQILMGQESIEIDSIDQLKSHVQNFKQKRFLSKYRNLKAVYLYIQQIQQEDIELFVYTVFSAFGKSEIFGDKFERKLITDMIQQQSVYFHIGIEFSQVNNVISKYKSQPQISQLIGHFTSIDNLQEFYLLMSNHNQLIQIDINSDFFFEDVCMLNKIFCKWQEITKLQYVAYSKQIINQLTYNPQASFYDLYDLK